MWYRSWLRKGKPFADECLTNFDRTERGRRTEYEDDERERRSDKNLREGAYEASA
jgi:hypothetical protein